MALGRPKKIRRSIKLTVYIPEDILAGVQLELYSDLEKKVPHGAISELAEGLFAAWLEKRRG